MYDNYIGNSKFREIRNMLNDYTDYGEEYNGMSIDEIASLSVLY